MPLAVFSPTKKVTGGCAFFKAGKDGDVFLTVFPQKANNPSKKDNFNMQAGITIKLNSDELGQFLRAVRTDGNVGLYHTTDTATTTVNFNYYSVDDGKRQGFGLTVKRDNVTVKVGVPLGTAEKLAEFFRFVLRDHFIQVVEDDEKRNKEYLDKKNKTAKTVTKTQKSEPEAESDEEEDSELDDPELSEKSTSDDSDESW